MQNDNITDTLKKELNLQLNQQISPEIKQQIQSEIKPEIIPEIKSSTIKNIESKLEKLKAEEKLKTEEKINSLPKALVSCPKCHRIPLCTLAENEIDKLKMHCPCSFKGTIQVKDFINENRKIKGENKKCSKHSKKFTDYCINCQKWLCETCVDDHEKYISHNNI